jgi:hypothetical protein
VSYSRKVARESAGEVIWERGRREPENARRAGELGRHDGRLYVGEGTEDLEGA